MWTRDNLDVLRGLNSESIDLVYADPPFNSNKNYEAPIGSKAAGAAFKDTWTLSDVDVAWHGEIAEREPKVYEAIKSAGIVHGKGMRSYLTMMAVRLLELRRVLKQTGSLYLPTRQQMRTCGFCWTPSSVQETYDENSPGATKTGLGSRAKRRTGSEGTIRSCTTPESNTATPSINSTGHFRRRRSSRYDKVDDRGVRYKIYRDAKGQERRVNLNENRGAGVSSVWGDVPSFQTVNNTGEKVGYPTQKPLALLDRIIKASNNEGDIVLDPFCGCATACVSAESLGRQWIGIDLSEVAANLVESRLRDQFGIFAEVHHRTDVPQRTDLGDLPNYRTHKHTLFGKQEGHCGGCRMMFPFRNFEIDHIIPRAKGGHDHLDNLQLLCGACNRAKATGTQAKLIAKLRERGQFAA